MNQENRSVRSNPTAGTGTNRLLAGVMVLQVLTLAGLWTGAPSAGVAQAAGGRDGGSGIPDPGARQMQMIDELKQVNVKLDRLVTVLESGSLQVRVAEGDEKRGR